MTGRLIEMPDGVRGAYGELLVISPNPDVQVVAQYDIEGPVEIFREGGGTVDLSNGPFLLSTGTTAGALAAVQSPAGVVYRAGQGIRCRFTAKFDQPSVADSSLVAGLANPTDAFLVGYRNEQGFGILHRYGGRVELRELTIDTPTAGAETVTVVIDGVSYPLAGIPLGTIEDNARTIATALNATAAALTWEISACGAILSVYSRIVQGPRDGVYSVSSDGALTGTWVRIKAGVAPTTDFTPQAIWNLDNMGFGTPEVQVWSNFNVFELRMQYLGAGALTVCVEDTLTGNFKAVHRIRWAGTKTVPSFSQPSFRMGWFAQSRGSTTNLTMSGSSGAIFNEGPEKITGLSWGHDEETLIPTGVNFIAALVMRVRTTLGGLPNLAHAHLLSASVTSDANKGARVRIIKNPTLDVNFSALGQGELMEVGVPGSVITDGDILDPSGLPRLGIVPFDLTTLNAVLLAGDILVIAINLSTGADATFIATLGWAEDF